MTDENQPAFLRLFIALPVPEDVRGEIARVQGQLKRSAPPGSIRWTRADQFHLTLKFLGDMPSTQLEALKKSVAEACAVSAPIQLSAHGMGFFPNAKKPRVLWAGADDEGDLLPELHRRIHEAVLPFAPADSSERFSGHITLGRFKPGHHGSMKNFMGRAALFHARQFGNWRASEVEIIRSELTSEGAAHTPDCICPLAAT
jgi:2'-5' RNA ligase